MKTIIKIAVSTAFLLAVAAGFAQKPFSFHLGAVLPVGGFANKNDVFDEDQESANCGAAIGFTGGLRVVYPLEIEGLGVFAGVDIVYNALKKDVRDQLEEDIDEEDAEITFFKYFNIPVAAGLEYKFPVSDQTVMFVDMGAAFDFFKVTKMTVKVDGETITMKFDNSNRFGFTAGGGVFLNEKMSLGISYYGFDKKPLTAWLSVPGEATEKVETDKTVGFVTITMGLHF